VITTTGERNIAYAQDLGADQVIGYRAGHFEDGAEPVDAAIDLIGQRDGDPFVIGPGAGGVAGSSTSLLWCESWR
jgi:NADPH:quinone reductase-like Zn-dependent oxidoreductase